MINTGGGKMGKMLFSTSEFGWRLIALAATMFFMLGMGALPLGIDLPDDLRDTLERRLRVFYFMAPVLACAVLAVNLLRPNPSSEILFLYSVAFAAIPVALFPVRARLFRAYVAQHQNPDARVELDRLALFWIVGSLTTVIVVATIALMAAKYGT
ncbi:hypothetical protein GCM10010191_01200 [Actinomadura vinacea]|uniref:DUF1772 domain-containing protein n=1 Tax=Actinomadura vinacea TaxID=115336 RepID=A0ABN3I9C1_9ACTN